MHCKVGELRCDLLWTLVTVGSVPAHHRVAHTQDGLDRNARILVGELTRLDAGSEYTPKYLFVSIPVCNV